MTTSNGATRNILIAFYFFWLKKLVDIGFFLFLDMLTNYFIFYFLFSNDFFSNLSKLRGTKIKGIRMQT
jgi:hypothetical protein